MSLQLKKILEQRKMSILSLSKITGITQANLSNIANGKASPKLEILERIATALGLEAWELIKEEKESPTLSFRCPCCGTEFNIEITRKDGHSDTESL